MELLHQLGELFLQAVPTVVIVLIFFFFMRWAFFGPVLKAMADRKAHIQGARAEAAAVEASAKQEMDAYTEALRKERGKIYAEQELAREAALEERAKLLKAMRARAVEDVDAAKKQIAAESAAARADVETQTPALAVEIARLVLQGPSPLREGSRQ
jgi:F0F1-type ATP synthase membrane subunit b/b'